MRHNATRRHAEQAVKVLSFDWDERELYEALEFNDALAGVFARLNLWWLPQPLPSDEDTAWDQYIDAWRPGKPHRGTWADAWAAGESVRVLNNVL